MASKRTNFSPESTQRTVKFLRDIIYERIKLFIRMIIDILALKASAQPASSAELYP